jgi:hypothetical protein
MIEILGTLAEVVGAGGVIASLLYLAHEVRANSKLQLRTNHRLAQEELHTAVRPAVESAELSELVVQAMDDLTSLEEAQRYRVDLYMMSWLQNAELIMLDEREGLIAFETVEPYRAAVVGHLRSPGGRAWWAERRYWFTRDGQKLFDDIIEDATISGAGAGVTLRHG